jgi:ketosteroid isomerase-like protein
MFRVFSVMILGLLLHFGGQIPGQEEEPPPNPEMQREEIVNLEKEAARAIQTNTGTFFRRVYADDFAGTLSHGQVVTKTTFISAVQTGEVKYDAFIASDTNVRLFRDAAIATSLWSARGVYKEQRFSSQMRTMHVYINTPHGWRVVSGQITLLPPGAQLPL